MSAQKLIVEETLRSIKSWQPLLVSGSDPWSLIVEFPSPFEDRDVAFPTADGECGSAKADRRIVVRSIHADDVDALITFLMQSLSARRFVRIFLVRDTQPRSHQINKTWKSFALLQGLCVTTRLCPAVDLFSHHILTMHQPLSSVLLSPLPSTTLKTIALLPSLCVGSRLS